MIGNDTQKTAGGTTPPGQPPGKAPGPSSGQAKPGSDSVMVPIWETEIPPAPLYRGRSLSSGTWTTGTPVTVGERRFIASEALNADGKTVQFKDLTEVDPDTLTPFTGRYDCNGDKIFIGDYLAIVSKSTMSLPVNKQAVTRCQVAFRNGKLSGLGRNAEGKIIAGNLDTIEMERINIIGNIFDSQMM